MIRSALMYMLCFFVALAMPLHGAAAMACDSAVAGGDVEVEMADAMIADCPACAEADFYSVGADSCSVACSSINACIHTGIAGKAGESASVLPELSLRTERSLAVEPPPPRAILLV